MRSIRPMNTMRQAGLTGLVVALTLLLLPPAIAAAGGGGGIGLRLLDAPVDRRDDPRAQVAIVDHLQPGDVIERRIEVSNDSDSTQEVRLYPGGAEVADGRFQPTDARSEATGWITIVPESLQVGPGEQAVALVRVAVPTDTREGEYYAAVWAEPPAGGDGGVRVVNRVGLRLYLSVGPGEEPASDFVIRRLELEHLRDGSRVGRALFDNTGGRALDVGGRMWLTEGPGGLDAGPLEHTGTVTVAPGDSGAVEFALPDELPAGEWTVRVVLRSGRQGREAVARMTLPDEPGLFGVDVDSVEVDRDELDDDARGDGAIVAPAQAGDSEPTADTETIPPVVSALAAALVVLVAAAAVMTFRKRKA